MAGGHTIVPHESSHGHLLLSFESQPVETLKHSSSSWFVVDEDKRLHNLYQPDLTHHGYLRVKDGSVEEPPRSREIIQRQTQESLVNLMLKRKPFLFFNFYQCLVAFLANNLTNQNKRLLSRVSLVRSQVMSRVHVYTRDCDNQQFSADISNRRQHELFTSGSGLILVNGKGMFNLCHVKYSIK